MKNRFTSFFPSLTFSSPFSRLPLSYLLLTFLTLFAGSVASAQIPSSGLVGYWPFNGNANDESGNGNNGTVNGATLTTDRFGNANSAYSFNSSNINVGSSSVLNISNTGITISVWLRKTSDSNLWHVLGKRNQCGAFHYQISSNYLPYGLAWGGSTPGENSFINSGILIQSNQWNHVVGTYSEGNWKLFLNSVFIAEMASPITDVINSDLIFGNSGECQPFVGILDDISIYNRALTPAEITQLYTDQTSLVEAPCPTLATNLQPGLVGYWPFCGNANDESGNGNNGTVNGASLTTDRFGNANSAYSFDGVNDIITVNDNSSFEQNTRTVNFWLKTNNSPISRFDIIGKDGLPPSRQWVIQLENNGSLRNAVFTNTGEFIFNSNVTYPYGNWQMATVVQDGTTSKTFINGILSNEILINGNLNQSGELLRFGGNPVFGGQYYNGFLDDISIYNRALTPTEITQLYTDPSTTPPVACTPFLGEDQTVCAGTSVTLSASGSSLACPTLPSTLQNGLAGYWPFCGNANDASGNGNNGTVNGATLTTDRFGNVNSAYSFDGVNDYIVTNNISFANGGDYSISLWVNLNAAYSNGEPQHYLLSNATTLGGAYLNTDYNQSQFGCNSFYSDNSIGNWHHYVGIKSGNTHTLRIDNQVVGSVNNCNTNFINGYPVFFGNSSVNTEFTNGIIDDISIYNRALTAAEIQQLYTLGQSTYLWSTGATTATINVTPTATTTYTCTVTDANGNVCTDSLTVFVPQIEATDLTICAGETTTLSVSGINSTVTPSACPTLPTNLQTGLVGYWPFCGNANDASGNGNNGTVNGATLTTDRFGNANSAYSFDGDDFIGMLATPELPACTINLFYKLNSVSDPSGIGALFSSNWYSFMHLQVGLENGSNQGVAAYPNPDSPISCVIAQYTPLTNLWRNISATYDGYNLKLYDNGILVGSNNNCGFGNPLRSSLTNYLGRGFVNSRFFNGSIDDVTLYNRALNPSEIQQIFTLGQTTYLWSTGATTPTINVSPSTTTTYTCTVTTNGVSCTDSVTVAVNNPVIDLGADVTVCGNSTTLTAPIGYDSYLWSNGGTTNTTTVSANGTYSCTVTQGGCSATDAVDVTLVNAAVSASDSTICAGQSVTLSVPQGAASSTACALLPSNLQTGLVGYWPFCSNANDASGNGHNGTVNGATLTTDRFGNANSAYTFNGVSSKIEVLDDNTIDFSNSYSLAGWYNTGSSTQSDQAILGKGNPNGGTGYHLMINTYANLQFGYNDNPVGNVNGGAITPVSSENLIGWHLLIGTYDGNFAKLYFDGVLVDTKIITFSLANSTQPLLFGSEAYNLGRFFNGNLDDIGLWNRSLSSSEVQQLFSLGQTTYLWSNGATTPNINVSPSTTTTYTCTVTTNGVSCTDAATVVVSNPVIDLGADVTVCGTSTTLTAPSGYDSYLWSNGGTTNTTTVTTNGTYSCTVTQGVCSASDSIDVTLIDATITASDSIVCAGETVTLSVPQGGSSSTACAALPTNLQTGLVGYWPFCGNANDVSGNGNNLINNGAVLTVDQNGIANSAYHFNGSSDYFSVLNSQPFDLNNEISFSIWLKPDDVRHASIIDRLPFSTNSEIGYRLSLRSNGEIWSGFGSGGIGVAAQSGSYHYTAGNWMNISVVYTVNNTMRVYVNGVFICQQNISGAFSTNEPFEIGRWAQAGGVSEFYYGSLDDLGAWNRALTPSEIQQLYTLGQTTYLWSNGATTPTVNVSPTTTTTYTCTVTTNGVSCTDTVTVVVGNPVASITPNGIVEICQGQSIALTANGGISYLWNTGAPTQSITVNTEAVYTVTVTDANGCTDTESQLVKVNFLPNIGVNNSAICSGQSATLTATGGLSYEWSPATGLSSTTGTTVTASPSTSTVYTLTGTGANGCTNTATAAVTVNAAPTATITPATATTFCQGGSVVLNANTGAGLSYQWRLNGTNITGATSSSYTANASGSYTVVVTNTSTCSATSTATVVTVNALPIATITPATATTFCQGGSVVLNANTGTGLSYQWFNNAAAISGATSSSYTANASGSYTVVVTNTSTCSTTSTATVVTVNALPTATITPVTTTTFCQGGSVVLNANTGTGLSYQWFNNAVAINGATTSTYTANASGSYTVVVTNTSTCSATSTATVVTVNALPAATITPATTTTFCQGGSVVLNANTGTGLTYQWRLNGTNITGATTSSYTANASGSYTVVVTNTSTCSATSTATVVTVNALPSATITPATVTTFCQGGSVVLNANTGTGLSYQWYNNASIITGATTSSYTANASGSYTVVVTNTSTCSATSTATVVTVNALPTATITASSATTFCQGGSVVLTANTGTGLTYQWRLNGTNITGATTSSYTANASGSYTVVVTNTSTCSATSSAINVTAVPNVNYYADADGDGFGDAATVISTCVQPQGYVTDNTDCDDTSADVNPAATEVCNHIDDDCSGTIDDGLVFDTYYADVDGDTFGDANNSIYECSQPSGYVTNNTDCNDNNANQNTASTEICNGEDDDCDGAIDNGLIFLDYYADLDSDGFGAGAATNSCVDLGAGYVNNNTDCNDNNANQNTASTEICNGEDDDCDGTIDNGITFLDYYADTDGDGFGAGDVISSCSDLGAGYVSNNTDCDDSNSNINSSATETCNSIDDNCDGQIDEGVQTVYFIDNDGDTYGNPSVSILACTQPIGYTPDDTDCNDTDANISPGAEDIGGNGIDENCDGEIDNSIFELNATISLYPNPTRSELNIQVNSSIIGNDLYIFDAVGKLVFKQQLLSTQTTIPVSNFADGNYAVRVGEVVKRFVIEK